VEARSNAERWLFGPLPDLLLGCGLGYAALFAAFSLFDARPQGALYGAAVPLLSILTGTPHYGATLLRVYGKRSERRAYALFAVHATALVWATFYLALYQPLVGSFLLTLYLSWSPWHYSGQNYGIALMFLRRGGVEVTPAAKRSLYLGFLLSFLLALLATHGPAAGGEYAPVQPYQGGVYRLLRVGLPAPIYTAVFAGTALLYLGALVHAGALLSRRASPRAIAPAAALALTQALWFAVPAIARWSGGPAARFFDGDRAATAFFWIATGHSVQYLWITTYYAAKQSTGAERLGYLAKTLLAGSFVWGVPAMLYTYALEGGRLSGAALGQDVFVVLAAAVNIHHFVLDGAIWKLRDGRVARILIRREAAAEAPAAAEPRRPWLAAAVYGAGALATAGVFFSLGERQLAFEPALRRDDLAAAQRSLSRLDAFGYESADDYRRVAGLALGTGDVRFAQRALEHSLRLQPQAATFIALGRVVQRSQGLEKAQPIFEAAYSVYPDDPNVMNVLGLTYLQVGKPELALPIFTRLARMAPRDETVRASLERARSRVAAGGTLSAQGR
jgi:tetratricopeptide (TPR) repeat protein